jgi:hypothetical protein
MHIIAAMLIAASVYTTQMQKLVARWKLEGGLPAVPGQKVNNPITTGAAQADVPLSWEKPDMVLLPEGELGPTIQGDADYSGTFVVYDWDKREIIWQADWKNMVAMPAGYCFADGYMYIADLEAGNIFQIDADRQAGKILKRISHPYMNDLHSLERTKRGLLVTASGTDAILEVDLDGKLLWDWWAADHGYNVTPSGKTRTSGRGQEHRNIYYHTRYQTTHLNCATVEDADERYVLCLLFHQGQLIRIDRSLPYEQQKPEVVMEGLARPHSLERMPGGGWIFCNSLSKELVLTDENLKRTGAIVYDGGWIQDCTRLPNGNILLNDVDNHVLIEFGQPDWQIVSRTQYSQDWRMGELVEVPAQHENAFRVAAVAA